MNFVGPATKKFHHLLIYLFTKNKEEKSRYKRIIRLPGNWKLRRPPNRIIRFIMKLAWVDYNQPLSQMRGSDALSQLQVVEVNRSTQL